MRIHFPGGIWKTKKFARTSHQSDCKSMASVSSSASEICKINSPHNGEDNKFTIDVSEIPDKVIDSALLNPDTTSENVYEEPIQTGFSTEGKDVTDPAENTPCCATRNASLSLNDKGTVAAALSNDTKDTADNNTGTLATQEQEQSQVRPKRNVSPKKPASTLSNVMLKFNYVKLLCLIFVFNAVVRIWVALIVVNCCYTVMN